MIKLYSKNGLIEKSEIKKFDYNGSFMGECFLSVTLESDSPINFEIGDYCVFRGEKFNLNYEAAKNKKARRGSYGGAFVYDNVKLNFQSDDLTKVEFLDIVPDDNEVHYSSKPTFEFYAESAHDLAERIQANLDLYFTGEDSFTLIVSPDIILKDKFISISSAMTLWDAVALFNTEFGLNYIVRNRTITVGTAGMAVGKVFGFGIGNGLYDIQQTTNVDARIITRLRAYGSTRNSLRRYYNELKDSQGNPYVSESVDIPNLMLPNFPYDESDPRKVYIDSDNVDKYGLRWGSVYFDGSDRELTEIYPSIEGMTKQKLNAAGVTVSLPSGDNGNINEVLGANNPTDDGLIPTEGEGEIPATFTIILKDLGFDLSEKDEAGQYKYAASDTMQISMKSGKCVARTFDVVDDGITKDTSLGYTRFIVECNRSTDDSIQGGTAFPNNKYEIEAGDKFVILGISLPEVYVKDAAQRLLVAAQEYLSQNDETKYTYVPKIDEIFMANNPELGENIKEGDIFNFLDEDLGIDASVTIQTLKISYDAEKSLIPTYDVVLSDERISSPLDKMQNSINMLVSNQTGINIEQVKSLVQSIGSRYFLSRLKDDMAHGNMSFMQNVSIVKDLLVKRNIISEGSVTAKQFGNATFTSGQFGSGFRAWIAENGQSYAEFDNILARREFIVNTLTAAEIKSVGGQILLSLADMVASDVTDGGSYWKVSFDNDNGTIPNNFAVDDQVICRKFNGANIKYYWARVTSVGADYINISKTDKDGSGVPAIGDEIIQFGNRTNTARQSAIILSAYGSDAPSIKQYAGINSYDLTGKEVTVISPSGNKFKGDFTIQSSGKSVTTAINDAKTEAINTASTDATNKVNNLLSDISNDNLLTPSEKQTTLKEWNIIQGEYNTLVSQADEYGISSANYKTKYNDLNSYVSPLLTNMTTNSAIVGNTFRNNFKSYYDAKIALLKDITDKAKQLADNAQQSADTANNELTNKVAYSEYNSQMQVLDNKIASKVSQTDFNTLGDRVSVSESNITQLSGSITSVVEKVDNIQVGGRNYVLDSKSKERTQKGFLVWKLSDKMPLSGEFTLSFDGVSANGNIEGLGISFTSVPTGKNEGYFWYPKQPKGESHQSITKTLTRTAEQKYICIWSNDIGKYEVNNFKIEKGNKATEWSPAPEDVQAGIDNAQNTANNAQNAANQAKADATNAQSAATNAQTSANAANNLLTDIANDNKLTPNEKQITKKEWDSIVSEYSKNTAQATKFGVSYTTYQTAYNALNSYITPLLSNLGTTSDINGATFRATFKAYYDTRTDLLNAISIKAKELADDAQTSANDAQNTANLKNRTYYQDAVPTVPSGGHKIGDLWHMESLVDINGNINADTTKNIYQLQRRWDGSEWVRINWSSSKAYTKNTGDRIEQVVTKTGIDSLGTGETLKSLIDLVPDQIKLEVSKVQVGGRNLLLNSNFNNGLTYWINYQASSSVIQDSTFGNVAKVLKNATLSNGGIHASTHTPKLIGGNEYIVTLWLKADAESNIIVAQESGFSQSLIVTPEWKKYTIKGKWSKGTYNAFYIRSYNDEYFYIANVKFEEGNKATDWTPAPEDIQTEIDKAQNAANTAQTNANEAKELYNDISNDDKLTPNEKQSVKKDWDNIVSEYTKNIAEANKFSVSTAAYTTAYNTLNGYISPLLSNMTVTSNIVGTTFRSRFNAYHSALIDLLNSISSKAKEIADSKTTINEVKAGITINSDGITAFGDTFKVDTTLIANAIETDELSVGDGNFRVGTDGKIKAKGATIEGKIRLLWNGSIGSEADTITVVDAAQTPEKTKVIITPKDIRRLSNITAAQTTYLLVAGGSSTSSSVTEGLRTWYSQTFNLPDGRLYDIEIPPIYLACAVSNPQADELFASYKMNLENLTTGASFRVTSGTATINSQSSVSNESFILSGRQAGGYRLKIEIYAGMNKFGTPTASYAIPANAQITVRPINDAIEIGGNGIMGSFTSSRYFHFTTDGYHLRIDATGFKVTSGGVYVSDTMNSPTPTWRKL